MPTTMLKPEVAARVETFADLHARLGGVPLERILMHPAPGTATIADWETRDGKRIKPLCELVEGTLVEKPMSFRKSGLAVDIIYLLTLFVNPRKLGKVYGGDGPFRMLGENIRYPDVSFVPLDRIQAAPSQGQFAPSFIPSIVVEVISPSTTRAEMAIKRREYFALGVELVWQVDADDFTVTVFTSETDFTVLRLGDKLTGGTVLPGFETTVAEIFADELPGAES